MIKQLTDELFIGDIKECPKWSGNIIHACKHPCFTSKIDKKIKWGDKDFKSFLEDGRHLYLNMIDPESPDRPFFPLEMIQKAIDFSLSEPVLIHCRRCMSRSPSVALLRLKRSNIVQAENYNEARAIFTEKFYPQYKPNGGIESFLTQNWNKL